tara:strand:+ start:42 stop:197 length:156 start_codon:yes stop_codon:yes gene_type:complete
MVVFRPLRVPELQIQAVRAAVVAVDIQQVHKLMEQTVVLAAVVDIITQSQV